MIPASIPSPSFDDFQIGPLSIHVYGILMGLAVATAYLVTVIRYERFGGDRDLAERAGFWAVVIGFTGARIAYVSTHFSRYQDDLLGVFRLWEGGIALFGGLTAGAAAVFWVMYRSKGDFPLFADSIAVALPAAQAIGRWGNYFNQELFGTPSDLPWALEIEPANRPTDYATAETFHPTFLYESLYNLALIALLLWLERRLRWRRGRLFATYMALYGVARFLLELIRTDTTFRFLGLSRNGWVALAAVMVGAAVWWWLRGSAGEAQPGAEADAVDEDADRMTEDGEAG